MTSPTKSEKGPLVALYHWVASCNGSLGGAPPASKLVRASSSICIQRGSTSIAFWPISALFLQESALSSNHRRHRLLTPGLPATGSGTAPITPPASLAHLRTTGGMRRRGRPAAPGRLPSPTIPCSPTPSTGARARQGPCWIPLLSSPSTENLLVMPRNTHRRHPPRSHRSERR